MKRSFCYMEDYQSLSKTQLIPRSKRRKRSRAFIREALILSDHGQKRDKTVACFERGKFGQRVLLMLF